MLPPRFRYYAFSYFHLFAIDIYLFFAFLFDFIFFAIYFFIDAFVAAALSIRGGAQLLLLLFRLLPLRHAA